MVHSIALFLLALTFSVAEHQATLSAADVRDIRANLDAYRLAWLRNSQDGVLATLAEDAVIMPHHGGEPSAGLAAIAAYWFSPGPATVITAFDLRIDEIGGTSDLAFVRGRSTVSWTVEQSTGTERWSNTGTFVNVLVKRNGTWKTRLQMWDDPPNRRER